jgi:tetratricopeptide (TPR) repeat protein
MHDLGAAGLKGDMGAAKGSIGTAHLKLGDYERAIEVFREGLELLGTGSPAFQREIWDGIAAAHEGLDQPREALAAFKCARSLEQKLSDASAVASLEKHEMRSGMARVTAELSKLADEDALTGLANRRAAERALRAALEGPIPRRWRCFSSTSTTSRRSTIASATAWATACCANARSSCGRVALAGHRGALGRRGVPGLHLHGRRLLPGARATSPARLRAAVDLYRGKVLI